MKDLRQRWKIHLNNYTIRPHRTWNLLLIIYSWNLKNVWWTRAVRSVCSNNISYIKVGINHKFSFTFSKENISRRPKKGRSTYNQLYKTGAWFWFVPLFLQFIVTEFFMDTSPRRTTDTLKSSKNTREVLFQWKSSQRKLIYMYSMLQKLQFHLNLRSQSAFSKIKRGHWNMSYHDPLSNFHSLSSSIYIYTIWRWQHKLY